MIFSASAANSALVESRHMIEARQEVRAEEEAPAIESMLVFRAGSPQPKAVPLSLVTRLEEIDARRIEMSSGRPMVQYRGQLMPLVPVNDAVHVKTSGSQPLLVFSDENRSMALMVDEIIDIIKGLATEVIDVAHFLPLAFDDWRSWKERRSVKGAHNILLIDDAAFFRNMLAPILKAAGYAVTAVGSASEALAMLLDGRRFDVVITDLDMPGMDGFEFASAVHGQPTTADLPIIGLSALVSAEAIERGRQVGLNDYVAKFDRQGLIAALQEQTADLGRAA